MAQRRKAAKNIRKSIGERSLITSSNLLELTSEQKEEIKKRYEQLLPRNTALLDEIVFILEERVKSSGIKIHGVEKRVKPIISVLDKCTRKGSADIEALADVVGARVICLFRSDMASVGQLIADNFEVNTVDDKLSETNSPLGYLSVHYSCKMPSRYKGPRYENTANITFEIQVRTLCMHAWAAVSHYLDYKGDWDVPTDLKRALGALSGLFYVADNEFEQFYAARVASQKQAEAAQTSDAIQEINLDTVSAYLRSEFPDRPWTGDDAVSSLVQQMKEAGYTSLVDVKSDIKRGEVAFKEFEKKNPPLGRKFNAIGIARLSLSLVSDVFYQQTQRSAAAKRSKHEDELLKYRTLIDAAPL